MGNAEAWESLRKAHPWPEDKPNVPQHPSRGWLSDGTKAMLESYLQDGMMVVELGAWLGLFDRWLLDNYPRCRLVSIDWFQGSPELSGATYEHLLPVLHETYQSRCWEHRKKIVSIKATTVQGLRICHEHRLAPHLIYVDADHYTGTYQDIITSNELFQDAILVGDDWRMPSVQNMVQKASAGLGRAIAFNDRAWVMFPTLSIKLEDDR